MVGTDHRTGNIKWEGKELIIEKVETLEVIKVIFRGQNLFVALKFKVQVFIIIPFLMFQIITSWIFALLL